MSDISILSNGVVTAQSDINIGTDGKIIEVVDSDNIQQYVGKILLTDQGASTLDTAYGSTLDSFIGSKMGDDANLELIKQTIISAIGYAVNNYSDSLNPAEQIQELQSMTYAIDFSQNASVLSITLTIISATGKTVTSNVLVQL